MVTFIIMTSTLSRTSAHAELTGKNCDGIINFLSILLIFCIAKQCLLQILDQIVAAICMH